MFVNDRPKNLLGRANTKILKGIRAGYATEILHLAPSTLSGTNVCPAAIAAGCEGPCLNTAGRGKFTKVQEARIRKTKLFFSDRKWFMSQLHRDIEALQRRAYREGFLPAVRLNGTSDIDWAKVPYVYDNITYKNIFQAFPLIQFYDYTKYLPQSEESNYRLTFSYSGEPAFKKFVAKAIKRGMNIAVVFRGDFPETFLGMPVVSGEDNDLRFLDPVGHIIALKEKGKAKKDTGMFVVDTQMIPAVNIEEAA
jgi:hypothetical protein